MKYVSKEDIDELKSELDSLNDRLDLLIERIDERLSEGWRRR